MNKKIIKYLFIGIAIYLVSVTTVLAQQRAKKSGGDKDRDKFFTGERYPQSI